MKERGRRFAADSFNGSKDDAKSRDLGSRRWAAVAATVVAASRSVVRIAARVDLTGPGGGQSLRDISAGSGDDAAGLSSRLSSLLLPLLLSGESAATWGTTASRRPGRTIREVRGSLIGGWLTTESAPSADFLLKAERHCVPN